MALKAKKKPSKLKGSKIKIEDLKPVLTKHGLVMEVGYIQSLNLFFTDTIKVCIH